MEATLAPPNISRSVRRLADGETRDRLARVAALCSEPLSQPTDQLDPRRRAACRGEGFVRGSTRPAACSRPYVGSALAEEVKACSLRVARTAACHRTF